MQVITSSKSGRLPYKWIVAIVVIFGSFMSILDQTVVNNAFPSLQHAFTANLTTLQWVITGYTLTQGVVTPTTGFFCESPGNEAFLCYRASPVYSGVRALWVGLESAFVNCVSGRAGQRRRGAVSAGNYPAFFRVSGSSARFGQRDSGYFRVDGSSNRPRVGRVYRDVC